MRRHPAVSVARPARGREIAALALPVLALALAGLESAVVVAAGHLARLVGLG